MIASMRSRSTMASIKASLAGVAKRDVAIACVLTALGLALMYLNVHDHHADPAEFKKNTAIYFGGLLPYGFAIPRGSRIECARSRLLCTSNEQTRAPTAPTHECLASFGGPSSHRARARAP